MDNPNSPNNIDSNLDPKKYKDFLQLSILQNRLDGMKKNDSTITDYDNIETEKIKELNVNKKKLMEDLNNLIARMSPRQLKLYISMSEGQTGTAALREANYGRSRNPIYVGIIQNALKVYKEIENINSKMNYEKKLVTKDIAITILSDIIKKSPQEKNKMAAIALLSKIMGYEAPTKTINENMNNTIIKFEEE